MDDHCRPTPLHGESLGGGKRSVGRATTIPYRTLQSTVELRVYYAHSRGLQLWPYSIVVPQASIQQKIIATNIQRCHSRQSLIPSPLRTHPPSFHHNNSHINIQYFIYTVCVPVASSTCYGTYWTTNKGSTTNSFQILYPFTQHFIIQCNRWKLE